MTARTSQLLVGAVGVLAVAVGCVARACGCTSGGGSLAPRSARDVGLVVVVVIALSVNLVVGAVVALARRDNPGGLAVPRPRPRAPRRGPGRRLRPARPWAASADLPGSAAVVVRHRTRVDPLVHSRRTDPLAHPDRTVAVATMALGGTGAAVAAGLLGLPAGRSRPRRRSTRRTRTSQNPMVVARDPAVGGHRWAPSASTRRARPHRSAGSHSCSGSAGPSATSADSCSGWSSWSPRCPLYVVRGLRQLARRRRTRSRSSPAAASSPWCRSPPASRCCATGSTTSSGSSRPRVTWVLLTTIVVATYAFVVWLGRACGRERAGVPRTGGHGRRRGGRRLAFPLRRALQDRWTGGSTGGPTTPAG